MKQGGLILVAGRVRSKERNEKKRHEIPPHPKHTRLKRHFFSSGNLSMDLPAAMNTKGDMSDMPSVQPTEQPRTSPPGSREL